MDYAVESLKKHFEWRGKIEVISRVPVNTRDDLSLAYTPGVAEPCLAIQKDPCKSYTLTRRSDIVAVVTDGTAVLGLGDIGPEAAMPVMEGKALLFKELGGVDAVPLCIRSHDVDEIVNTIRLLAGSFGGINLEDISAPRCFEIERHLRACCDIPVFHDDQHGTAIVVLAAVLNSLRITGKKMENISFVINGAGAAGIASARLLADSGAANIILCDRQGAIYKGRNDLNAEKRQLAETTNPERLKGSLAEVMAGTDVFIGVSAPGCVSKAMVESMNKGALVFPMSNPTPEIMPDLAKAGGAVIVGTGRSDFPNQINNALAFPGVFRGALNVCASDINETMKIAAARAIANHVSDDELTEDHIMPSPLDRSVAASVAEAVAKAAKESGVSRMRNEELEKISN
jgi:malate dehydrogenase (oxaloacetate-decarboxylating)